MLKIHTHTHTHMKQPLVEITMDFPLENSIQRQGDCFLSAINWTVQMERVWGGKYAMQA